ncbi:hypothetical protein LWI28_009144 [Acer negundo]|uniref:Serine/threonine-protein kinase ATM n=1 Tax=Acer negundo TaxID=4023 RepID=A0AAD5NP47_ACENE|nr:hypothetical protein LWI28_009144 [Acer negundo]
MATITSRDVEEIVSKLSSDKAKAREEGVKLLSTWLEGVRSIAFCKFLGRNTAKLKPNELPHSETWPFIVQLLTSCISSEISANKRRPPKINFAKTLKIVIQRAEDAKFSGLLLVYMEKVESSLKEKNNSQHNQKEEIFRCISTLHSLLENPPGDIPETLRGAIVKGFVQIFSFVRDDGKILRKLIECINTFLLKDGPNLGRQSSEIHDAVQKFVYRCWLTTHDRSLKDALILYARLQLNLTRGAVDQNFLVEQLLDVVFKELDQSSLPSTSVSRSDATKDDKFGTLSSSQHGLVELAALVFYRACVHMTKAPSAEKRARREHTAGHLRDALMKGKWIWNAVFCCLIHNYYNRISKDLFMYWFEGVCTNFERILNDANMQHTYDGLLWTLRSMQELSSVLLADSRVENPLRSSFSPNEFDRSWHMIWNCLMHGLPIFSNVTAVECSILNECMVLLLPAAVYAICAGCSPFTHLFKWPFMSHSHSDVTETRDDWVKIVEHEHKRQLEHFEFFVEVLANIDLNSTFKISSSQCQSVRLPRQLRDPLLQEMETYIFGALLNKDTERRPLSEIMFTCALLSNFMYGSLLIRKREEISSFPSKVGQHLLKLLDHAVNIIQENHSDLQSLGCLGSNSDFSGKSFLLTSFRSFICSPVFVKWREQDLLDAALFDVVIQSMERLLRSLVKLYELYSDCVENLQSELILSELSVSDMPQVSSPSNINKSRILDVDLDANEVTKNVDILTASGGTAPGISYSAVKWKLDMILLISNFFSVLHVVTWDILFELLEKECDQEVREKILYNLCQHPYWSSSAKVTDLVNSMGGMIKVHASLKLDCVDILTAIHGLLGTLLSLNTTGRDNHAGPSLRERESEQCLIYLGNLVNEVAEFDLLDWFGRVKLINCICDFVSLNPQIGQTMIERLLLMLQDPDYRVRFFLARRIGVLFQTWDGHEELFQDICSNFGVVLVVSLKEKLVTAREALAAGPQPRSKMETVIITLMHLALQSEKIELQAVFMMCVISAIDPCQRELVNVVLNNLSQQLKYTSKWKYLEELLGSILFCWVACGVSLPALVEIRQLFISDAEPSYFMQYCCHWLLPALLLHGDNSNVNWVAKIACQPLALLVKNHFVPIFSVSMALHCSERTDCAKGAAVLQSSILHLAEISEIERDKLIKTHLVSIVSHILSLASSASDPAVPFFPKDTIVHAIKTVVDGFLEMEDCLRSAGVVDKINIFRPDRVFMFLVEMHYKIAAAVHYRHRCHRLAGIEVLINILGHRAAISSTSNYLFNLIGQFIGCHALQDQCCRIISALLKAFKNNPSKEIINVLGEQLQFLVSKLVACFIPSESSGEPSGTRSSQVLSLLLQLTLESDPSLHDYIRELEPFPEIDIFDEIRNFHEEICRAYSARDHLLKFVKRSCYLPSRLLSLSLQALHNKLLISDTFQREKNAEDVVDWHSDHEIVHAVWTLVRMCCSDDASSIRAWVSDFISRVGIWDPHCVVFHLPRDSSQICQPIKHGNPSEINFNMDTGISEELLVALLKVLKKCLMDDSVEIVDMTSRTLRVHSKGINVELVEKLLCDLDRKFKADVILPENSTVWETNDKTFEMWICPLVYSLIGYCNDAILRLCQNIVMLKSEVAELLMPSVFVNLAGRKDMDVLHKIISAQYGKPSSYSSKSRSTSVKARDVATSSSAMATSTSLWNKLSSQILTLEHEGNWSKALEYYELQVRSNAMVQMDGGSRALSAHMQSAIHLPLSTSETEKKTRKPYKGLIKSLQQIGCMHVLDMYCQGLTSRKGQFQHDLEFTELQYEAAWRAGNWDFSLVHVEANSPSGQYIKSDHFNENLHSCLRALQEGDPDEFLGKLKDSKKELVLSVSHASEESTEYIYSTIIKLQILYHLGVAWDIRWKPLSERTRVFPEKQKIISEPVIPTLNQLSWLNMDWNSILGRTQLHMNLLEPFIAFRRVLLQILSCKDSTMQHLLQSASTLRKGSRFSQTASALHELKFLCAGSGEQYSTLYWLGRLEEAKLLRAQGQHEMAINLAKYISENCQLNEEASDVYRLVGKWLAETRSSNSGTILEKYLKPAVSHAEDKKTTHKKSIERQCQTHFHLAHYADALFRSYEERLTSNEWQAAMRLRKHKTVELEALIKQLKTSTKGDKIDYSVKIQELQKQLSMDKEEAEKLLDDRDNFLGLALEGYKRCLVIGDKYDVRVVFRLLSLWFSLSSRQNVINNMLNTINEVQSYKFLPLVYQIASRMGSSKDDQGPHNFQFALVSLVKKMAIDHPYHIIFQLLALANGDRIKDKQRNRNSFVVDMDKKLAAENLLEELLSYHGPIIRQMKQMVEIYIKLAELETRREDTNKRITLPREIRSLRQLELVPVVTATVSVDRACQYREGSFPYFKGLADSIMIMNGINAPKVVECLGSDGCKYKQLAKSGNDDLRQDAVMEQVFGLVNTFLRNHRDTWKRRLGVRTYKVVPFTPSAGVLEWVDGTLPLGEYLIGSMRNGGAHGRYGIGDWSFLKCREHMSNGKDKRAAFQEVYENFRPVMHYFFVEKFLQPADWFEKRLAFTRSVAASSMVGYIVGLGDRHAMNILIDQATAEVVHIDLGVAFEQGLMLKTPERVPFRLTRDIIDGMGVTGVEGVFRRCCEKTVSVMRTNKEALLTIVEVFIHDPLYKWALSPLKALQRQKDTDDDLITCLGGLQDEYLGNKDAARALMRVKQKLDGYEEGEMRSVHGQVQQLIQDAIDPERLCLMFPGWAAWL